MGCHEREWAHFGKQAAPEVRVLGPRAQASYLLMSLHVEALVLPVASLTPKVRSTCFIFLSDDAGALWKGLFLSTSLVLEVPGERQNGSHTAKGNINICLGNRGMGTLFALRVDPRGQEAGLTTPLSFLRNWVGQEPSVN